MKKTKKILTLVALSLVLILVAGGLYCYFTDDNPFTRLAPQNPAELNEYEVPSKYQNIKIKSAEEQSDERRYLMHVSWPVTENDAINEALDAIATEFIADYHDNVERIQAARKDYIAETGTDGATFHVDYNLHFDVSFADQNYVAFTFTKYRNTGNTGNDEVTSIIYNRVTGEEIPFSALFTDDNYLEELSSLARADLYGRVESAAESANFDTEAKKADWIDNFKTTMMDPGTAPTAENYHSLFIDESGDLVINFDKYQVAPGTWGVVTVKLPLSQVAHLFSPAVKELFGLDKDTSTNPTSTAPPVSNANQNSSDADCTVIKCVALTFDDGPSVYTEKLLNILEQKAVVATFFMLGVNAKVQQQSVIDVTKAGMEIGNHTWNHHDLTKLDTAAITKEVEDTADLIAKISGTRPILVRPPYGAVNALVEETINTPLILWNVDPEDWKYKDTKHVETEVLKQTKRNSIILMHDIYNTTVAAVPMIIDKLQNDGYTFVTVSTLLKSGTVGSGHVHY